MSHQPRSERRPLAWLQQYHWLGSRAIYMRSKYAAMLSLLGLYFSSCTILLVLWVISVPRSQVVEGSDSL